MQQHLILILVGDLSLFLFFVYFKQKKQEPILRWRNVSTPTPTWSYQEAEEGVVVGCNQILEWMLPWWFMNFRVHNHHPITFVNFGDMTERAVDWCAKRGAVRTLDCGESFIAQKEELDPSKADQWQARRGNIWVLRKAWMKVPFALLSSPYERTIWMDLDCQVVGSIEPIFREYLEKSAFVLVKEAEAEQKKYRDSGELLPEEAIYNAGVIGYRHGSEIVTQWAARTVLENKEFMGNQKILARILHEGKFPFSTIPDIYNWPLAHGQNRKAVVLHYWGAYQDLLKKHIGFLNNKLYIDLSI